jgi:hypothetical protein
MLPTINFYDQLARVPGKIGDIDADRRLPAKVNSERL